jgi:hypothetical protein
MISPKKVPEKDETNTLKSDSSTISDDTVFVSDEHIQFTRNVASSKFKGVNYVFDERIGARITADVLSLCESCGEKSDMFTNCQNYQVRVKVRVRIRV